MKLYLCYLGDRINKIYAKNEQHARIKFQENNGMWSNSVIVKLIK